jgi:hypothetical protein
MRIGRGGRGDGQVGFNHKGCLMKTTKCPVCQWEIKDGGVKVQVAGKEVVVCCDDCAKKANESPAKYAGAAE